MIGIAMRKREHETPRLQLITQVAVTGVLTLALAWKQESDLDLSIAVGFIVAAVPLAGLDLRTGKLPNWLVLLTHLLALAGLALTMLVQPQTSHLLAALAGVVAFTLLYGGWYALLPGHIGGGDLKLAPAAGAVLGWHGWPAAANSLPLVAVFQMLVWLAGALLLIWGLQAIAYVAARAAGHRPDIALRHGTFLVLGTVVALLLVP
ncbi:prepilin peptidase [Haloechinothrix salitolerans]|uniref:Prepilin peptidase n=1 Tax=Haloechinothrix salitolerans TaxID=926830 RepID=A0ABW2BVD4_9PSEU